MTKQLEALALRIFEDGCVTTGTLTDLAHQRHDSSRESSPIYFELGPTGPLKRTTLTGLGEALYTLIKACDFSFDHIAAVPEGANSIARAVRAARNAEALSLLNIDKQTGVLSPTEDSQTWEVGDRILLLEDAITFGGSIIKEAKRQQAKGMQIAGAVGVVDREQGGIQAITNYGVRVAARFSMRELLQLYRRQEWIDEPTYRKILDYLSRNQAA